MESAREVLLAERERALRRVAALEGDFDGIVEAAGAVGTDDEHDPEGATLAFERQHTAALLGEARERILAAQPAGSRAPATAMTRPARPSRISCGAWYTLSTEGGSAVCAALPMTRS